MAHEQRGHGPGGGTLPAGHAVSPFGRTAVPDHVAAARGPVAPGAAAAGPMRGGAAASPQPVAAHRTGLGPGLVLGDRYKLLRRVGSGGMGDVWEALHTVIGKPMAVKVLSDAAAAPGESRLPERFMREARAIAAVRHENVVDITDFGHTPQGDPYFVMELLEGRTLKQLVDEEGGVPWERGRQLLLQLADGLEAVHSHGIIHRDLKPDNVFVIDRGRGRELCKIIDFGIAKTTELDDRAQSFTRTGMVFGTPAFMSPEQARGEAVDARSDIYAFGCIAFHLLTGVRPFEGNTPTEVLYKHLFTEAPSLRQVAPGRDIPAGTEAVVLKCLRKDRELRFPDMRTLREALTGVGTTTPMVIVPSERLPTPPGFAPPPGLAPPAARPPTPAELSAWQVGTGSSRMAPPPTATGGWATSTGSAALASQGVAEAEGTRARTGSGRTIALVAAAAVALGVGVGGTVLWLGDPNPASAPAAAEAAGAPASPSPGTTAAAVVGSGLPAGVVTPTSVPAADAGPPPDPTVESSASTAAVAPTGGGGARGSARPTAGAVAPSAATPPGLPSVAPEAAPDPAGPPAEPPPPAEPAPAEGDFSAPAASAPVPDPPKKKPRPAADGDLLDPFKQH